MEPSSGDFPCVRTQVCPILCNPVNYIAHQAPLSMAFPRQEYWNGLSFPFPGDLTNPGIKPRLPALEGVFFTTGLPGKPKKIIEMHFFLNFLVK